MKAAYGIIFGPGETDTINWMVTISESIDVYIMYLISVFRLNQYDDINRIKLDHIKWPPL